ncbi:transposase [Dietzia sp. 179-F 9C3 NHS]|uniref:transposase n=1 Tax=Dietzia sp. 179-F 9C3 NHS TaxID=3374295 RepID=UPI0038799641
METSITREGVINAMGAPRKYPDELRERAARMALEALADPGWARGAIMRTAEELGVHREALRTWVRKAQAAGEERDARREPTASARKSGGDRAFPLVSLRANARQPKRAGPVGPPNRVARALGFCRWNTLVAAGLSAWGRRRTRTCPGPRGDARGGRPRQLVEKHIIGTLRDLWVAGACQSLTSSHVRGG